MHKFVNALGYLTILLLVCTLICGIWIGNHPGGDMYFHAMLSGISVVVALISQIINMCKCKHCKRVKC